MIDTGVLQLSILAILLGGNVYAYLRFQVDMKAARAAIDAYDTIKIERRSAKSSLSILESDSRRSRSMEPAEASIRDWLLRLGSKERAIES